MENKKSSGRSEPRLIENNLTYQIECADNRCIGQDKVIETILNIMSFKKGCDERHFFALMMLVRDNLLKYGYIPYDPDFDSDHGDRIEVIVPKFYLENEEETSRREHFCKYFNKVETCRHCGNYKRIDYDCHREFTDEIEEERLRDIEWKKERAKLEKKCGIDVTKDSAFEYARKMMAYQEKQKQREKEKKAKT